MLEAFVSGLKTFPLQLNGFYYNYITNNQDKLIELDRECRDLIGPYIGGERHSFLNATSCLAGIIAPYVLLGTGVLLAFD